MRTTLHILLQQMLPTSLIVLLLISNFVLYWRKQQWKRVAWGLKLDPFQLRSFSIECIRHQSIQNRELRKVVFFGDSRAMQWPPPNNCPGFQFINLGISGQTSVQVAGRFNDHVSSLAASVLVVQVGINDVNRMGLFPHHREQIIETCKQSLAEIVEQARSRDIFVVLTTVFPFREHGQLKNSSISTLTVHNALTEINNFIRTLYDDGVFLLDLDPVLSNEKGYLRSEYSLDQLHLNPVGYQRLNSYLSPLLSEIEAYASDKQ